MTELEDLLLIQIFFFFVHFILKNNCSDFNGIIIYAEVASFLEKSL